VIVFLDASALVKLYHDESGTDTVHALLNEPSLAGRFFISDHVSLEVFVRLNRIRRSSARRDRRRLRFALNSFDRDRRRHLTVLQVDPQLIATAEAYAGAFPDSGAGTLDLIHLASAFQVQRDVPGERLVLVAADRKLRHVAKRAGLRTFDLEQERPEDLGS